MIPVWDERLWMASCGYSSAFILMSEVLKYKILDRSFEGVALGLVLNGGTIEFSRPRIIRRHARMVSFHAFLLLLLGATHFLVGGRREKRTLSSFHQYSHCSRTSELSTTILVLVVVGERLPSHGRE